MAETSPGDCREESSTTSTDGEVTGASKSSEASNLVLKDDHFETCTYGDFTLVDRPCTLPESRSHSKLELFNLNDLLTKHLCIAKKERIIVSELVNEPSFQLIFSCFHNYETQAKRDSHDKVIKMLGNVTDDVFSKDFLFYFLLAYRFIWHVKVYGRGDTVNSYWKNCIMKFETINVQTIANVMIQFFQRKDFLVQFHHDVQPNVSVFQLMYEMSTTMLDTSNKLHKKSMEVSGGVYYRMLWIAFTIRFGLQIKEEPAKLADLWKSKLFSEEVQREFLCSKEIVQEFKKGFELLRALGLPESSCFDGAEIAVFLNPVYMKTLYISHITSLMEVSETYFSRRATFLCQFLLPIRSHYQLVFNDDYTKWERLSVENTKLGVYKEALKFLDYILCCASNEQNVEKAHVIETEIKKWLELLVDSVDMFASNAAEYFKVLCSPSLEKLSTKYRSIACTLIQDRGVGFLCGSEFKKRSFTVSQFNKLFKSLNIWHLQFVEEFLNNYIVTEDANLQDGCWKDLFKEIICRFPDVHCRNCIMDLMDRISKGYKNQDSFIIDLMKMDVPNLLLIHSPDENDSGVEHLFISRLSAFIQRNTLNERILCQVENITKLVKPGNHLQGLILAAIQKEIFLDIRIMKELNSTPELQRMLSFSIKTVCNSLLKLPQLSEVDSFYWHFIALCCKYIQPNSQNLDELIVYKFITLQLRKIHYTYCEIRKMDKVIHEIPHEFSNTTNADVKDYFKWVLKMQNIVFYWKQKFDTGEFNFDDTLRYAININNITEFAEAMYVEELAYDIKKIIKIKEGYSGLYAKLCLLLVKNSKDSGWCTLVEMLRSYDIKLSPTIQTLLDTHIILPGMHCNATIKDTQQRLNLYESQLELDAEMILIFRKSMTWKVLQETLDKLQVFLEPILQDLDFLVYFYLHHSEIFDKHLRYRINKVSVYSQRPMDASTMNYTVDLQQLSTDPAEKLKKFASALQQTKELMLSLIRGTAKFEEIFVEGSLEDSLQKLNAEKEFEIICGFSEFQKVFDANEEGKKGIKHMIELFQYSQQISHIPSVCGQFGLCQCLDDPKLKELMQIVDSVKTTEDRTQVTGQIANNHMRRIREILKLPDSVMAKGCLKIFPAVANCAEFYQFIKEKGFTSDRAAFNSQVELITAQLQHEDYNENVLNHLMPAFQYITPFLDAKQNLTELMDKVLKLFNDGDGFGQDSQKDFCQLETVNSNITMIQLWFSRTEGDTVDNVYKELECILKTGHFKLTVMQKRIVGTTTMYNMLTPENSTVCLHYEPAKETHFRRQRMRVLSESHNEVSSPISTMLHLEKMSETWNNDQIDDFVRKLGFLETQSTEVEDSVKFFQQINQTAQKLYKTLLKLRDLGHPDYMDREEMIFCYAELELAESRVTDAENALKKWRIKIKNMQNSYKNLLFFNVSKVLSLHSVLKDPDFSANKMIQEIGFLFENSPRAVEILKKTVENSGNTVVSEHDLPIAHVGKYLDELCDHTSVGSYFLYSRSQINPSKRNSSLRFQETVHFAPNYDSGQLLRLLFQLYNGIPESYEVFHCNEGSTEEDLKLFLNRAAKFGYRTFTILSVNMLPYKLQELILHHHSQETHQTMESLSYIETSRSILHEMPWVVVKEYQENGPDLSWEGAKHICDKYTNKRNSNFDLELVYGLAGDGKTHYIHKKLHGFPHVLIIAVNESFTTLNAILKLKSLPSDTSCRIFFNFTISASNNLEEKKKYKNLMNTLAWFFFKLLIFEYIEDPATGIAFRLPAGRCWKIFVEVPSFTEVAQGNAKQHLKCIQDEIPIFKILGNSIEKTSSYDIDSSVRLVCKYLNAYDQRANSKRGINRLFRDNGPPVKFGDGPNLNNKQCYSLMKKYMPSHVTENKILQQLYIRYMERRCNFMESFPGFCYNTGIGTIIDHSQLSQHKLKEMLDNGVIKWSNDKYYTNTTKLGEVIMETMLQEVSDFCKIDMQQNWTMQAHQQLIYEVKERGGSIWLLAANPDKLDEKKIKKFKAIGIEIPSKKQLLDRKKLDTYLSAALNIPLEDERLQDIDDENYVLTIDYTIKMLSIHERHECGIPVIIEGETGVGKTALINMLSKLWNHALINELRSVKKRISDLLPSKSLDQNSADCQFHKELDATDKRLSEEELLPLLEKDHTEEDETVPCYQFINRKLLEIIKCDILELLDIDPNRRYNVTNREHSVVTHLIGRVMAASSAQATAGLLCTLLNGKLIPTFYKLNIHAALSPKEIQEFFIPIIELANYLLKMHNAKPIKGMEKPPVVTVFLDEINTSSCMGLFKEMITDKTFEGEPMPSNIFIVAACNPNRSNSLATHANKEHEIETWVKGTYTVQKLHPAMKSLMWDYGSLNDEQESHYINEKMIMVNINFDLVQNVVFSKIVVECQRLTRQFAREQLKYFGIEDCIANLCAASCVSQRDIQRVFTFYCWISKTYHMMQKASKEGRSAPVNTGNQSIAYANHPKINEHSTPEQMRHRALLVALGLVYYARLNTSYREKLASELDKHNFSVKFQEAFTEEMNFYTNKLILPTGIAKSKALKENLFATIICTVTKTPLIIVGAPGSSKTLSFNLTISNLKGQESKQHFFRNTEIFKSLDPQRYQCSRRTTSTEIETVFQRAVNRQRSHNSFSMPIRCVVFMDEAGLPEESHESLKALHYHLDQKEVAFVAITNHILDAAKTNRAVSLFRPTASKEDLQTLARGCLCGNPSSGLKDDDLNKIEKLCDAYCTIMKDPCFKEFFGLRDFIHFINYIQRKCKCGITAQFVLESLERNFNGTKRFKEICLIFLQKIGKKLEDVEKRSIIEILHDSLADKPHCSDLNHTVINERLTRSSSSSDDTQNEVRYKLLIDPTEDDSIIQLLFMFDILKRENTHTYMCSDFFGDGQLQKVNTIAAIRHSAIAGHTVIMSQTDDIHESFYDLFNQHFCRIIDPEAGPRYFTNIAIGAHVKPSRVDQNFQCIVVVKESEIKNTPTPFLNRFEKYFVSHNNLLTLVLDKLPPCLRVMANLVYEKVEKFYSLLHQSSFYGGNKETVCSLLLSILPRPGHKYKLLSESSVHVSSEVNSIRSTTKISSNKVLLLQIVVKCLHKFGGFCYMESSIQEMEHDANNIIDLLTNTGSMFSGIAKDLKNHDTTTISQWITEALNWIYLEKDLPNINMTDQSENDNSKPLGASDGACLVTAVVVQWILRFMCKKLMQLMMPESAILNRKCIPVSYLETYLNYQTHFSIKELIKKQSEMLAQCDNNEDIKVATKMICYTRTTSTIHELPAVYPNSSLSELQSDNDIKNLICEKADSLFLCKLSSVASQTAFKFQLQTFVAAQQQTIFVLIVNMQEANHQVINHIRIMIGEAEHVNRKLKKLFILLLHFPAMMFYDPCYPSLFLHGWDHYYLDAIDRASNSSLVDTKEWFRQSCLPSKEVSSSNDSMLESLLTLLRKQESILIIASRILLNIDSKELSQDSLPDITTKVNYLKMLLIDKKIANVLCLKFKSYWTPSVMGNHLEQAARFSRSRESTLNISDSVDSMYRSAFFNFVAYMLYQISINHCSDVLLNDQAVLDPFLRLLEAYTIPKLIEIKAFNNTWDSRVHTSGRTSYVPQFPFFMEVSSLICKMVEESMAEILQETENSNFVIDSQKKEMVQKLYHHACKKVSVIDKGESTAEARCMSAVAIMEMRNDETMWQKYYNDFIYCYLHLSANPDDLEHELYMLQKTFVDVLNDYNEMKAITVHCYMHLYQLDLARIIPSLKSLRQLQVLKKGQDSLYPGDQKSSFIDTYDISKSVTNPSSISEFVIKSSFAVLVKSICSKDLNSKLLILQKWFNSYRNMMSIVSLKSILSDSPEDECLKAQCNLMEVTFLVLLSFQCITSDAAECACVLASRLCNEFFNENFEFIGTVPLSLKQIVTSFNAVVQIPQFTEPFSSPQSYNHIIEGLFTYFFPDSASVYSKGDIEFFLEFTNEKDNCIQSLHSDSQPKNLLKFKVHLDRILCKGWSKSGASANPLDFYKSEICICVGEIILSQSPEVIPKEYVSLHLQQTTKKNESPLPQQMLMHLYFYTVLEKLQTTYQLTPELLVMKINITDKIISQGDSNAERIIAVVERQALLEVLIQAIVNKFDLDIDKSHLLRISEDLNLLIKDESHYDILLMHLMKKWYGTQGVLKLLSEEHKSFYFFASIKEKLEALHPSTSHQFPFISDNPSTENQLNAIYKEICDLLCGVAKGASSKTSLRPIVQKSKNQSYTVKSIVPMMIWLCVYYDFYCEKKQNVKLIRFFEEHKSNLGLSKEHLNILSCFLDPSKMVKNTETNPIWEFFNPDNKDQSDIALRHALANMTAVVFSLPSRSTHLWYHMFAPGDLRNSYLTGFMYPRVVKKGGPLYDCGCILNEYGYYGRSDYRSRDTFSLHSWYLLLWTNFGAFCVALLTKHTALEEITGHLLSDQLNIGGYCMTQLRTVWSHIRQNMSLGDEERSFFIMRSMYQLFTLFHENKFPNPQGKFTDLNALINYEKSWHKLIYKPVKANLKEELENYSSHSHWALPIFKNYRIIEQQYPHVATEIDYIKSLVDSTEAKDCNHTHLFVLQQFTLKQKILQLGGALLPDLVEFYKWIHTHLSYLVTYEKACKISIGKVIDLSAKRYSQEVCDHLTSLFDRIISKYNNYLTLNRGTVRVTPCNGPAKLTNVHDISKDTPLIKLLSLKDIHQNDWLYIVLVDIIQNHNVFLDSIITHAATSDCHYKIYVLETPPELYPTEVTSQNCIIPCDEKPFIKLINTHYIYNGFQSTGILDLYQLERDVVKFYIAGKPLIINDNSIRSVFRFSNSPTETTLSPKNPGCATDLSAIAQELPDSYKEPLDNKERQNFEYHFRTASYYTITEIVGGLRTVTGQLIQDILQGKDKGWDPTISIILFEYLKLKKLCNSDTKVFYEIGIQSASGIQCKLLGDIEIKKLFKCLELFVDWLQGGWYDFTSLPISMFRHMNPKDMDEIKNLHTKDLYDKMDDLLSDLNEFEKSLYRAENHLTTVESRTSSIIDTLVNLGFCKSTEKFVSLIPKSVLVHHYVYFRMTLRRLKIRVTKMGRFESQNSPPKWSEIIDDLWWKHLSHFKGKEKSLLYESNCAKLYCKSSQFVDGEESTNNDSVTWVDQGEIDKTSKEKILQKERMTTKELCQWLKDLGISDSDIKCFEKEEINGRLLANCNVDDLKELGIKKGFTRKIIITKFQDL